MMHPRVHWHRHMCVTSVVCSARAQCTVQCSASANIDKECLHPSFKLRIPERLSPRKSLHLFHDHWICFMIAQAWEAYRRSLYAWDGSVGGLQGLLQLQVPL